LKTELITRPEATSDNLIAVLVPKGEVPSLGEDAPAQEIWEADFKDDADTRILLRGSHGARWFLIRLPESDDLGPEDVREAAGHARLAAESRERCTLVLDMALLGKDVATAKAAAEGAAMAGYDPGILKENRKEAQVDSIQFAGVRKSAAVQRAVEQGVIGAAANLYARDLQNLPPNLLTPENFAAKAREVCKGHDNIQIKVLSPEAMKKMGMGSLLGVAQGSVHPPRIVHMTFTPEGKTRRKVAIVGKGLTFDSGGISLKPPSKMDEMKFDMSGAAAVLGVFHALSHGATCKDEVHGIMGLVENMPGNDAQRPGDIVTASNGKTIEVLNTDAEGRLVLADVLHYTATEIAPKAMYDMATLTGAVVHALGHLASAVLGNSERELEKVQAAGERVGERCWPLPLWEEHKELAKGKYADLKNIYAGGQGAGTTAGAAFLSFFVGDVPWVHLDIAGTAWNGPKKSYMTTGGRGVGTRIMLDLVS